LTFLEANTSIDIISKTLEKSPNFIYIRANIRGVNNDDQALAGTFRKLFCRRWLLKSLLLTDPKFAVLQLARGFLVFSSQLLSNRWLAAIGQSKCLEAKIFIFPG